MISKIITLILLMLCPFAMAIEERIVDMQWSPIPGAVSYEFELYQKFNDKFVTSGTSKIDTPNWSKKLNPGIYQFRIRSIDFRGVSGPWSDTKIFMVKLPNPLIIRPLDGETIVAQRDDQEDVRFQWQSVIGAEQYYLKVEDNDGKTIFNGKTTESYKIINLNVAKSYSWTVWAMASGDDKLDTNTTAKKFVLLGGILDAPELDLETTQEYLRLKWNRPTNADYFYYEIFKKKDTEWVKLKSSEKYKNSFLSFNKAKIRPGHYRFAVQSLGENRGNSSKTTMDFLWTGKSAEKIGYKEGEKKEDNKSDFEKSTNQWLALAYLDMPTLAYSGEIKETNTAIVNTLSGQRIGFDLIYKFKDSNWRLASQFLYKTYVTLKAQWSLIDIEEDVRYVKKYSWGELGFGGGLFIHQHPVIVADKNDSTKLKEDSLTSLGEKLRLSAGLYFTDNIQALVDFNLLINTIGLTSPEGSGDITSSMSQVVNAWLGYIYKDVVQFRVGYSVFNMTNTYLSGSGPFGPAGKTNSANYTGSAIKFGAGLSF